MNISKFLLIAPLCLSISSGFSQNIKPKVFSQYPDVINCNAVVFQNAFSKTEGDIISLAFSNDFTVAGKVSSNIQKYANLQSMTIQLPGYANAVFHLSKQINSDLSLSYVGRIMSTEAQDGYEIKKDDTGNYALVKIEEEKIRQICGQ